MTNPVVDITRVALWWYALCGGAIAFGQSLLWSTFLGGSSDERPAAIAADRQGNVYVAGVTTSTDFNAPDSPRIFNSDIFVTKLDRSGAKLIFHVRMGGSGTDRVGGMVVDDDGNAYVTGTADIAEVRFPTKNGAFSDARGFTDTFVVKLDPAGGVVYSTLLGIGTSDGGVAIAVDRAGNAYVASQSHTTVFSGQDTSTAVYITKLNSAGSRIESQFRLGEVGGEGFNTPSALAVDVEGNIWVSGYTTWNNFPVVGSERPPVSNIGAGFLVKLDGAATQVLYSSVGVPNGLRLITASDGAVYAWTTEEPRYGPILIRSSDFGENWEGHDFLPNREPLQNLRFGPGADPSLFANLGGDLVRSTDRGRTWNTLKASDDLFGGVTYAFHPSNADILFAAASTPFSGNVQRSIDGGRTWKRVWAPAFGASAILVDPTVPENVYAYECSFDGVKGVRLSVNSDEVTPLRSDGLTECIRSLDAAEGSMFALSFNDMLLRTTDGGESWTALRAGVRGMKVRGSAIYVWTTARLLRSDDGGGSWTELGKGEFNDLAFDPRSEKQMYASMDSGIAKSSDGGLSWTTLVEDGGPASIGVDPRSPANVYAAFERHLTYKRKPVLRRLDGSGFDRSILVPAHAPVTLAAFDADGSLYVAGNTMNPELPVMNGIQPEPGGGVDTYLMRIRPNGSTDFASYVGSWDSDELGAMAVDGEGNVLLAGSTGGGRFPIKNAFQPEYRGNIDVFVMKIAGR